MYGFYSGPGDWDFTGGLDAVDAPVLVVTGDRPSAAPDQQRAWATAYPHGRLLVVPGAGKAAPGTHPTPVFQALLTFFASHWPATTEPPASLPDLSGSLRPAVTPSAIIRP